MDTLAETREKTDELIKQAAAAIKRAKQQPKQAVSYFWN